MRDRKRRGMGSEPTLISGFIRPSSESHHIRRDSERDKPNKGTSNSVRVASNAQLIRERAVGGNEASLLLCAEW